MREFYAHRIMQRVSPSANVSEDSIVQVADTEFPTILLGKKLFQQYVVDSASKIEQNELNFYRKDSFQKNLRSERAEEVFECISDSPEDLKNCGKSFILPQSHTGSPRDNYRRYMNAMAIVRKYGKPDLFLTFTCNPEWKEVQDSLLPNQKPHDRPDLLARAFNVRLKELLSVLKSGFGETKSMIHVVEFQKRGLPHAHILIILSKQCKLRTPADIDDCISAEIPGREFPVLRELVLKHMIHRSCGNHNIHNVNSVCCEKGKCTKQFPKPFQDKTVLSEKTYPVYKRRSPENGGETAEKTFYSNGKPYTVTVDNSWVVPYNPVLLLLTEAHLNVEATASIEAVKYLYKYVYKGSDKVMMKFTPNVGSPDSSKRKLDEDQKSSDEPVKKKRRLRDEIAEYVQARYIGASEGVYKILKLKLHDMKPAVQTLNVHLENQQRIVFAESSDANQLLAEKDKRKRTTLTAWFELNKSELEQPIPNVDLKTTAGTFLPRAGEILYPDVVRFYTFTGNKTWKRRAGQKVSDVVGRIYSVSPKEGERYFLRRLLFFVTGATSYKDLRTYNGHEYSTFQDACKARGLLQDDTEWHQCLEDAAEKQMANQLLDLFVTILMHCAPQKPRELWDKFQHEFSREHLHRVSNQCPQKTAEEHKATAVDRTLRDLADKLHRFHRSLSDFELPEYEDKNLCDDDTFMREVNEELSYNADKLKEKVSFFERTISENKEQHSVYTAVKQQLENPSRNNLFFVNAPGGTGKSHVLNALLAYIRSQKKIALPVASSGIASLVLDGGRTVHSRFKVPLEIDETSTCNISRRKSNLFELISRTSLIVWDEISMQHKYVIECVDRSLRDLRGQNSPFGGITTVFSGDWRQILPVIVQGEKNAILNATLKYSPLWKFVQSFELKRNMRVELFGSGDEKEFLGFVRRIGNNEAPDAKSDIVEIPASMISNAASVDEFVSEIFPDLIKADCPPTYFQERVILTPKNETVDEVNSAVLAKFPGDELEPSLSADTLEDEDDEKMYPVEFLNSITPTGLPKHDFRSKKGVPLMLIRNIDPQSRALNGSRAQLLDKTRTLMDLKIFSANHPPTRMFLPRISLTPSNSRYPFKLTRRQFPVRLAFAMTINKSQGQTLKNVGLYLPEPVFAHGQLYVAISRVGSAKRIKIFLTDNCNEYHGEMEPGRFFTRNVVYDEIFN